MLAISFECKSKCLRFSEHLNQFDLIIVNFLFSRKIFSNLTNLSNASSSIQVISLNRKFNLISVQVNLNLNLI